MLECEAFQIFCPLFNFSTLEMFPVFPAFPVFLGKKKEENLEEKKVVGKSCSIRTALIRKMGWTFGLSCNAPCPLLSIVFWSYIYHR